MKNGIFYHQKKGRLMQRQGHVTSIYWSADMISYLRRHFPNTLNEELAGCLGVSPRTMIRKARELGLRKNPEWLARIWEERRQWARSASRRKGFPGGFRKGEHRNPEGEFKPGHKLTPEENEKKAEKMRKWYLRHPAQAREKARKAWETRKKQVGKTINQ